MKLLVKWTAQDERRKERPSEPVIGSCLDCCFYDDCESAGATFRNISTCGVVEVQLRGNLLDQNGFGWCIPMDWWTRPRQIKTALVAVRTILPSRAILSEVHLCSRVRNVPVRLVVLQRLIEMPHLFAPISGKKALYPDDKTPPGRGGLIAVRLQGRFRAHARTEFSPRSEDRLSRRY
jgi:hypothetical protein